MYEAKPAEPLRAPATFELYILFPLWIKLTEIVTQKSVLVHVKSYVVTPDCLFICIKIAFGFHQKG